MPNQCKDKTKEQQIHQITARWKNSSAIQSEKILPIVAEYNGTKTQRYQYTVTDPNSGSNQEKYLTVGKRTSEEIDSNLSEGHTLLKIQRFGLGKDTRYHVIPAS